jgi:hypothetical protein
MARYQAIIEKRKSFQRFFGVSKKVLLQDISTSQNAKAGKGMIAIEGPIAKLRQPQKKKAIPQNNHLINLFIPAIVFQFYF